MVRIAAEPDYRECSDDVQFGFGDNECVAAAPGRFVNQHKPRLIRKSWCGNLAGDFGSCFSEKNRRQDAGATNAYGRCNLV